MKVICRGHKDCISWKLNVECKHRVAHEFCDTGETACETGSVFDNCVCESINKERKKKLKKIEDESNM